MNRSAVSSSTWVNSSSNWSITSSNCVWSSGRMRWTARRTPPGVSSTSSNPVTVVGRDAGERRFELLERMRRRCHVDAEPLRRHREGAPRHRRQQARPHHARLPAAAGSDDGDEASPGAGLAEPGDEPLDEAFAAEEVPDVGRAEGPQTLVRVLRLVERRGDRCAESVRERSAERRCVRVAAGRVGRRRPVEHGAYGRRQGAPHLLVLAAHPGERGRRDDGQAVDVRRRRRPARRTAVRATRTTRSATNASPSARERNPEVVQVGVAVTIDEDVLRLDVAVDHAAAVGRPQGAGDLTEHRRGAIRRAAPRA